MAAARGGDGAPIPVDEPSWVFPESDMPLRTSAHRNTCGDPLLSQPRDLQLSLFQIRDPPLSLKRPEPTVGPKPTGTQG